MRLGHPRTWLCVTRTKLGLARTWGVKHYILFMDKKTLPTLKAGLEAALVQGSVGDLGHSIEGGS